MLPQQGHPAALTPPQCLQERLRVPFFAHGGFSISEAAALPGRGALPVAVELVDSALEEAVQLLLELVSNEAVEQGVDAAVGKGHADAKWQRRVDDPQHLTAADDLHVGQSVQKRQNVEWQPGNQECHHDSSHQLQDFVPLLPAFPKFPCFKQMPPDPDVAGGDHCQGDEEAQGVFQEGGCHRPFCIVLIGKGHNASIDLQAFNVVSVSEIKSWEGGQTGQAPHNQCHKISLLWSSPLGVNGVDNGVVPVHAHACDEKNACKHIETQDRAGDLAHERPKEPVVSLCIVGGPEGEGGQAQQVCHGQVENVDISNCLGASVTTEHHNHHTVANQAKNKNHREKGWDQ